jgi:metal-responsive CopG/Arc/MetJ family transcriptional regulator
MKKSSEKKRVGRPPTGRTPYVTITITKQLLEAVDKLAREQKATRSAIINRMISDALARPKR